MYRAGDILLVRLPDAPREKRYVRVVEDTGRGPIQVRMARARGLRLAHGLWAPASVYISRQSILEQVESVYAS